MMRYVLVLAVLAAGCAREAPPERICTKAIRGDVVFYASSNIGLFSVTDGGEPFILERVPLADCASAEALARR